MQNAVPWCLISALLCSSRFWWWSRARQLAQYVLGLSGTETLSKTRKNKLGERIAKQKSNPTTSYLPLRKQRLALQTRNDMRTQVAATAKDQWQRHNATIATPPPSKTLSPTTTTTRDNTLCADECVPTLFAEYIYLQHCETKN